MSDDETAPCSYVAPAYQRAELPGYSPISRMSCTVDGCDWFHDDAGPDPHLALPTTEHIRHVMLLHYRGVEAVLAEHLATHEPIEYLRTIQRLNSRVAELEQQLGNVAARAVIDAAQALMDKGRLPEDPATYRLWAALDDSLIAYRKDRL